MTPPLGSREVALLRRLIDAEGVQSNELFVAVYTGSGLIIKHPSLPPGAAGQEEAALLGLDAARLLLVERRDGARPGAFYLARDARHDLAEAERQLQVDKDRAAAGKASGHREPATLAEMLERMIEAQKAMPGQFFSRYATNPHPTIRRRSQPGQRSSAVIRSPP